MPQDALPCIACGKHLHNVSGDCENQPYEGTSFTSHGHYGSTVFDPMNGHFIEINVCDVCLAAAGVQQRVLAGRDRILVRAPDFRFGHTVVGSKPVDRPVVHWHVGLPEYGDDDYYTLTFDDDEVVPEDISFNVPYDQLKLSFQAEEVEQYIKDDPEYVLTDEDKSIIRRFLEIPGRWDRFGYAAQHQQFQPILTQLLQDSAEVN